MKATFDMDRLEWRLANKRKIRGLMRAAVTEQDAARANEALKEALDIIDGEIMALELRLEHLDAIDSRGSKKPR